MENINFKKELIDKKINFLLGSGVSYGALPTLSMNIKDTKGKYVSFEKLASCFQDAKQEISHLLFSEYYCKKLMSPAYEMDFSSDSNVVRVLEKYKKFIQYALGLVSMKKVNDNKKCNIFTTNYDLFIEIASDELFKNNNNFILNDGGLGFRSRYLSASNFSVQSINVGVFDTFSSQIPTINLIKLHGSASWQKSDNQIEITYNQKFPIALPKLSKEYIKADIEYTEFFNIEVDESDKSALLDFWRDYKKLPIVNPTKWKFNETVFEQHYYQMLRHLSYELEKKDAYLIVFGFSFKDEHIYDLIKRSLMNPSLSVFIFCYDEDEVNSMKSKFSSFNNVFFITKHEKGNAEKIEPLDFDSFLGVLNGSLDKDTWQVIR